MANQPETVSYDAGVYQLEIADSVDGGVGAKSNAPLLSLANRTAYLKKHMDDLEAGLTVPAGFALLASPAFSGNPTAPTQAVGDNDTSIATTAFVQASVNGTVSVSIAGAATTTLTQAVYGVAIIKLTGAVTANKAVVFPSISGHWQVVNNSTGAFTVTLKTAAGSGVVISAGMSTNIYCDGTNVTLQQTDFISPALTGLPTGPTQPLYDNTKALATTEFVQRAAGNFRGFTNATTTITLDNTAIGTVVNCAGASPFTATMPAAVNHDAGAAIHFRNIGSTVVTVNRASADVFNAGNATTLTSILLQPGTTLTLVSNGSNAWWADGSAQLQYSKVLGYTPAQFDNSQLLANSEFVKRSGVEYSRFMTVAVSTVLDATVVGGVVAGGSASPINITLPPVAGLPDGVTVDVVAVGTTSVTVLPSGSDVLASPPGTLLPNIPLFGGDSIGFVKLTGGWRVHGGTMHLKYAAMMAGANWTTQAQFANDKSLATTEFVQRGLGSFRGFVTLGSSRALTAADIGNSLYVATNGIAITLPTPASIGAALGAAFNLFTTGSSASIVPGAGASINYDVNSLASLVIKSGQSVTLIAVSTTIWQVVYSTAELKRNADFAGVFGAAGWQKLPSGHIEQWGSVASVPAGGSVTVTLSFAMPLELYNVVAIPQSGANDTVPISAGWSSINTGSFTLRNKSTQTANFSWRALGI